MKPDHKAALELAKLQTNCGCDFCTVSTAYLDLREKVKAFMYPAGRSDEATAFEALREILETKT